VIAPDRSAPAGTGPGGTKRGLRAATGPMNLGMGKDWGPNVPMRIVSIIVPPAKWLQILYAFNLLSVFYIKIVLIFLILYYFFH